MNAMASSSLKANAYVLCVSAWDLCLAALTNIYPGHASQQTPRTHRHELQLGGNLQQHNISANRSITGAAGAE